MYTIDRGTNDYNLYTKNVRNIYYDQTQGLQLIYILDGEINIDIYGEDIVLKEGDLFIANKFQNRIFFSKSAKNLCLFINIKNDYLNSLGDLYSNMRFRNHIKKDEVNQELVKDMARLYRLDLDGESETLILNKIDSILKQLMENYIDNEFKISSYSEKLGYLESLEDIISDMDFKRMRLDYISSNLHLSKSHISKIFYEVAGIKFVDFIQKAKLCMSTFYLVNTVKTVEDIAYMVDFSSTKSLNRIFKKYLDMTPTEYRLKAKAKESKLEFNIKAEKFLRLAGVLNYESFIMKFYDGLEEKRVIDINKSKEVLYSPWNTIRNLKTLGKKYIKNLDLISEKLNIHEIFLRVKLLEEENKIVLTDIGDKLDYDDFHLLLEKCIENKITPIISLDHKIRELNKLSIEIEANYFRTFLDAVSLGVGINNMRKFNYIINIQNIAYIKNDEELMIYRDYIALQQRTLEEKLSTAKYVWGVDVGRIDFTNINKLKSIQKKLYKKEINRFTPSFLIIEQDIRKDIKLDSLESLDEFKNYKLGLVNQIDDIKKDIDIPWEKIYIKNMYRNLDISHVDIRYRTLFMVQLMMKSLYLFRNDIDYILDFTVKDKREKGGYYYVETIDKNNFFTSVYWSSYLMNKLKGNIIYMDDRTIVTRDGENIYVIIYGNLILDYLYGEEKGFNDLKDDKHDLKLELRGLEGKYKVVSQVLSLERGSIYQYIDENKNISYLSRKDREYLQRLAIPSYDVKIEDIDSSIIDKVEYSPFNLILRIYKKL